jgi:hypothetical protein
MYQSINKDAPIPGKTFAAEETYEAQEDVAQALVGAPRVDPALDLGVELRVEAVEHRDVGEDRLDVGSADQRRPGGDGLVQRVEPDLL